jgi:selenide,water dikinase
MMAQLNRAGSEAMVAAGAHAATDITGYGLLGHACEMAEASGVRLMIDAGRVPQLRGALDLYEAGFITRAYATNRDYLEDRIVMEGTLDTPLLQLLFDAQTSGGLLIALPESALDTFGDEMTAAGQTDNWRRVGIVEEKTNKTPYVRLR